MRIATKAPGHQDKQRKRFPFIKNLRLSWGPGVLVAKNKGERK
jgi:hypothetical protein